MKKISLFLTGFLMSVIVYAQDFNSVMIIPFDPDMYFSDSDEMLSKYNQKSVKEVRTLFRYGLNINLNARVMTQYKTTNLLSDSTSGALNDLAMIYKSITYAQADVTPSVESAPKETTASKGNIFRKSTDEKAQANTKDQQLNLPKKYMTVQIRNKELLPYLAEKYGVDVFLFCNQFNLQTNYQHCLDRATNTFQRDLMVHYTLVDKNGKQLAGGITQVHFPSNSNDIMEIMKNNFPKLSEQMASRLPGKPVTSLIKQD